MLIILSTFCRHMYKLASESGSQKKAMPAWSSLVGLCNQPPSWIRYRKPLTHMHDVISV